MTLPTSVEVGGNEYEIRSDYRAAIDIQIANADFELSDRERATVALYAFYPEWESIPKDDYQEAIEKCLWFLSGGKEQESKAEKKKNHRLVDWEQDFDIIVSQINKILGYDIRGKEYVHWFTVLSAYREIDSKSLFAQVVQIRSKIANRKKLDKADKNFYNHNRDLIDFKKKYTTAEKEMFKKWGV